MVDEAKCTVSKCYVMTVSHPRPNKISSSYKIHNHIISFVDHNKYLGSTIQNDLKWHQCIQSLRTSKANQTLALLIWNLKTPSIQLRERVYVFQSNMTKIRICCCGLGSIFDKGQKYIGESPEACCTVCERN